MTSLGNINTNLSNTNEIALKKTFDFYSLQRSRKSQIRYKRRSILKNGEYNVIFSQLSRRTRLKLVQDVVTYLVKIKWRYTLLIFVQILVTFFLLFGAIFWIISQTHGDFEPSHLPQYQKANNFTPCIREMYGFTSCLLFSIESQHTVGYGVRAPTEECPEAIFVNSVQCMLGDILRTIITGVIFAKITLPKRRTETLLFSRYAVVCLKDGILCMQFRVGDLRKNLLVDAEVKAILLRTTKTREGEVLHQNQTVLKTYVDDCVGNLHFIFPMTIVHKIDETSPFFRMSPSNLSNKNLEIVVILEGVNESTGQSVQARTSYTAREIFWGRKFEQILSYDPVEEEYNVDFSKFDDIIPAFTPLCSAQHLKENFVQHQLSLQMFNGGSNLTPGDWSSKSSVSSEYAVEKAAKNN